jgi:hypothetical protein
MSGRKVPLISALFAQAYMDYPLPSKILEAIRQGDSLKGITVADCTEQDGEVW